MSAETDIVDLCEACIRAVRHTTQIELDFSAETLPVLDHYARHSGVPQAEILELLGPLCGAYFGEVVRRTIGDARWSAPSDDLAAWRLQFLGSELQFNPVGMALEVITEEPADGWGAHLQAPKHHQKALADAIHVFGRVSEQDYYRFTVRHEVIEQAYLRLGGPQLLS